MKANVAPMFLSQGHEIIQIWLQINISKQIRVSKMVPLKRRPCSQWMGWSTRNSPIWPTSQRHGLQYENMPVQFDSRKERSIHQMAGYEWKSGFPERLGGTFLSFNFRYSGLEKLTSYNFMNRDLQNGQQGLSFHSVVVITCRLHRQGHRFEPGWKHPFSF